MLRCITILILITFNATAVSSDIPPVPLQAGSSGGQAKIMFVVGKNHRLFQEAYTNTIDLNGDGSIELDFTPTFNYYGYFNSDFCYSFDPGAPNGGEFVPSGSANADTSCGSGWSGNWLNWMTMTRMDLIRRMIVGGTTSGGLTGDETLRANVPRTSHGWARSYQSVANNGYNIADFTPYNLPSSGKHHLFATYSGSAMSTWVNAVDQWAPRLYVSQNSDLGKTPEGWEFSRFRNDYVTAGASFMIRVRPCPYKIWGGKWDWDTPELRGPDCWHVTKPQANGRFNQLGLVQKFDGRAEFGLITGSYDRPHDGGRLRHNISSDGDEWDPVTGINYDDKDVRDNSIWQALTKFRVIGTRQSNLGDPWHHYFNYRINIPLLDWETYYPYNFDWGNPTGEMMYEALRYFAGEDEATDKFASNRRGGSSNYDQGTSMDLPTRPWDPVDPFDGADECTAGAMVVFSEPPSFDSDHLPGSTWGSVPPKTFNGNTLDVRAMTNTIGASEGIHGTSRIVGEYGAGGFDGVPKATTIHALGDVRGLPYEPSKQGSFYSAGIAYFAHKNDFSTSSHKHNVKTIMVESPSFPNLDFEVAGQRIPIVPMSKTSYTDERGGISDAAYPGGTPGSEYSDWGENHKGWNQITDMWIDQISDTSATVRVNFDDAEWGGDFNHNAYVEYNIGVAGGDLNVTTSMLGDGTGLLIKSGYLIGGTRHSVTPIHLDPYSISGSPADFPGKGVHLVIQDESRSDTEVLANPRAFTSLDVPRNANGWLGVASSLDFVPDLAAQTQFLKSPLWYAAKWGGFDDINGNGEPDGPNEWDKNGDGDPDNYFLLQNMTGLEAAIEDLLPTVITETSLSNIAVKIDQSDILDSLYFQTSFNTLDWSGNVKAFKVNSSGELEESWNAASKLLTKSHTQRDIFTTNHDDDTQALAFKTENGPFDGLSDDQVNYLRGDRSKEESNPGGTLRTRASVLGDLIHSNPVYDEFTDTVYVGSNSGMLHGFKGSDGDERFAYIPLGARDTSGGFTIADITDPSYSTNSHGYLVDGGIVVSNQEQTPGKSILVATMGRGGSGFIMLDVSNPDSFSSTDLIVDHTKISIPIGKTFHAPIIAKPEGGSEWKVYMGGGYEGSGQPTILEVDMDGTVTAIAANGGDYTAAAAVDSGIGSVTGIDINNNGEIDHLYAGDLQGNIWRFDFSGGVMSNSGTPLFTARDANGDPQPITSPITAVVHNDPNEVENYGRVFLFFGTGSYYKRQDTDDSQVQTLYGVVDDGSPIGATIARADLREREIEKQENHGAAGIARVYSAAQPGDMVGKKGWFMDLIAPAGSPGETAIGDPTERITTAPTFMELAQRALVVSSFYPSSSGTCGGSNGRGFVNVISPFTGGRIASQGLLDVDGDGDFTNDKLSGAGEFIGGVHQPDYMPTAPVLVGNQIAYGDSDPKVNLLSVALPTIIKGRLQWREIK